MECKKWTELKAYKGETFSNYEININEKVIRNKNTNKILKSFKDGRCELISDNGKKVRIKIDTFLRKINDDGEEWHEIKKYKNMTFSKYLINNNPKKPLVKGITSDKILKIQKDATVHLIPDGMESKAISIAQLFYVTFGKECCYKKLDVLHDKDVIKCTICGKEKKKNEFSDRHKQCKKCKSKLTAKYLKEHPEVAAIHYANRKAMKLALPHTVKKDEWKAILATFDNKCMVTGKKKPALEHFIPLSWGHGGTISENIYPLHGSLNGQKSSKNPFDFLEELSGYHRKKFEEVICYIAKQNNMTWQELHKYVNWCEKNKRTVDQVIADNERGLTSIDLWKLSNQSN